MFEKITPNKRQIEDHKFVGKNLNENILKHAQNAVEKKIKKGEALHEEEMEKTNFHKKMIRTIDELITNELSSLNVEKNRSLNEDSIHIMDKHDLKKEYSLSNKLLPAKDR